MVVQRLLLAAVLLVAGTVFGGCPCGNDELPVEMAQFSGRFGYGLDGPYGFTGALTKETLDDPAWVLEGTFQFPSSGYTVLAPVVSVAESYPEQVHITLNVLLPWEGINLLDVITERPVRFTVEASNRATFEIVVKEYCW